MIRRSYEAAGYGFMKSSPIVRIIGYSGTLILNQHPEGPNIERDFQ